MRQHPTEIPGRRAIAAAAAIVAVIAAATLTMWLTDDRERTARSDRSHEERPASPATAGTEDRWDDGIDYKAVQLRCGTGTATVLRRLRPNGGYTVLRRGAPVAASSAAEACRLAEGIMRDE